MATTTTTPTTTAPTTPAATTPAPAQAEPKKPRRHDPFEMFQEELNRLWGRIPPFGTWPLAARSPATPEAMASWAPRVDVFEKNGDFVVKAELPGAKKEDIEVTLDQGDLVIRGQRKAETEVKEESYYRMEQSYGSFYRRLPLPFETTAEQITATYAEGILEIRIPKPTTEAKPAPQPITIA